MFCNALIGAIIVVPSYGLGLDKFCSFFCLLFFLTILKKSAYYSSLVYPLFQFKDVTFIRKDNLFVVVL